MRFLRPAAATGASLAAIAALVIGPGAAPPAFAQAIPVARADVDRDCTVTRTDATITQASVGKRPGQPGYNANADVNLDGVINNVDLTFVTRNLNARVCTTPPAAPTIVATVTPAANAHGWHNTDVSVSFVCTNAVSCPTPATVTTEGANQIVERTVANSAGVTATARVTLNIDKTPPVLSAAVPPTSLPGATVAIPLTITDLSGPARTTLIVRRAVGQTKTAAPFDLSWVVPADALVGFEEPIEIIAEDRAGNVASLRRAVMIDASDTVAPTVAVSAPSTAAPGASVPVVVQAADDRTLARVVLLRHDGTTTVPVEDRATGPFSFQAIAQMPEGLTDGTLVTFPATATDAAGNTGTGTATVRVVTSVQTTPLLVVVDPPVSPTFQTSGVLTGTIGRGTASAPPPATPIVAAVAPTTGRQGQTLDIVITGINTAFTNLSQVTFGPGLAVQSVVATDATHLTARVAIAANAGLGPRVVAVSTGAQEGLLASAFSVLSGLGSVTGRLLNAQGQPIANAQLCLVGTSTCVTTGADGRFTFASVPVDARRVVATAPGYDAATFTLSLSPNGSASLGDLALVTSNIPPPPPLPNSPPITPKLATVLGRGATEFAPGGNPEQLRKLIRDTIAAVGGRELGVLDETGQQLNPLMGGAGYASFSADAVEEIVTDTIAGDTISLAELFKTLFGSITFPDGVQLPTLLQLIAGLQDSIDRAWANPSLPDSPLLMVLFNQGRVASPTPPRINFDTRFNALQKNLIASSFVIFASRNLNPPTTARLETRPEQVADAGRATGWFSRVRTLAAALTPRLAGAGGAARGSAVTAWRPARGSHAPRIRGFSLGGSRDDDDAPRQTSSNPYLPSTDPAHRPTSLMWEALVDKVMPAGGWTVAKNGGKLCDDFLVSVAGKAAGVDGKSPQGKELAKDPMAKFVPAPGCKDALGLLEILVAGGKGTAEKASAQYLKFFGSEGANAITAKRVQQQFASQSYQEGWKAAKQEAANMAKTQKLVNFGRSFAESYLSKLQGEVIDFIFKLEVELLVQSVRPRAPFLAGVEQLMDPETTPAQPSRVVAITFNRSTNDHGNEGDIRWHYELYRSHNNEAFLMTTRAFGPKDKLVFHDEVPEDGTYVYYVRGVRNVGFPLEKPAPNQPPAGFLAKTLAFLGGFLPQSVSIAGHQVIGLGIVKTVGDPLASIYKQINVQASDFSDPGTLYVTVRPPVPRPPASLAITSAQNQAYLSVPALNTIFKVGPNTISTFANANFKEPGPAGLAADFFGNVYADNSASDSQFGGRVFMFRAFSGERVLAGTVNYYSMLLQYANPVAVNAMMIAPGPGGEALYIADGFNQRITRMTLPHNYAPGVYADRNVSQPYASSPLFQFGSTTAMAMRLDSTIAVTQANGLLMVSPFQTVAQLFGPTAPSPFTQTSGVAFDVHGHMYVSDQVLGTITMIPFHRQHAGSGMVGMSAIDIKKHTVVRGLRRPSDIKLLGTRDGLGYFDGERAFASFKFGMSGQVTDAGGTALSGAKVYIPSIKRVAVTDTDGIFVMTNLVAAGESPIVDYVITYEGRQQSYRVVLDTLSHNIVDAVFNPPDPVPPTPPGPPPPGPPPPFPTVTPPVTKPSGTETVSVVMDLVRDPYPSTGVVCPRGMILAPGYGVGSLTAAATVSGVLAGSQTTALLLVNGTPSTLTISGGEFSTTATLTGGENTLAVALPASVLKPLGCADATLADATPVPISTTLKVFHDGRPEVLAQYRTAAGFDLSVRGMVREGGRPLAGLGFWIPGTDFESTTDGDGVFQVNLPKNVAAGAAAASDTLASQMFVRVGQIVALLRNERRAESLAALEALLLQAIAASETPPAAAATVDALLGHFLTVEGTARRLIQALEGPDGIPDPADIDALEAAGQQLAGVNSNGDIVVRSRDYPELSITVRVQ